MDAVASGHSVYFLVGLCVCPMQAKEYKYT
jgi:hypothetical protein